jgi:hypothetical protein
VSELGSESGLGVHSAAYDERFGAVYNEEAFKYFLQVEQRRADRSSRSFLLMLVDFRDPHCDRPRMESAVARKVFAALAECLRETDFVGWYREGEVAGAVLTQAVGLNPGVSPDQVGARVRNLLSTGMPSRTAQHLRVRVCRLPQTLKEPF